MKTEKQLPEQAREATFLFKTNVLNKYLYHINLGFFCFFFNSYIGPTVNYGFEMWGTQQGLKMERKHLEFCKHI